MYSHKIIKRFIKDYFLPIQVIQEPYFNYFLNLYNGQYNTKEKYQMFQQTVNKFNSEEEFLNEYYKIRDKIIKTIESLPEYKIYNSMKMDNFNVVNKGYPSHDIFNMSNINKCFVSIDLTKANFQALKWLNKELVLNCDTYEELIEEFTDLKYMKNSKYLRQVIFGNINPKRQVKIERYITQKILDNLLGISIFKEENIRMVSNDEIIFQVPNYIVVETDNIAKIIKEELGFDVHIENYKLKNIEGSAKYFVKEFINKNGYELMCVPLVYHAQVYKRYNNLDIIDNDLLFYYENQICKFMNPLDFKDGEE